jgi:acetyl esterase
MPLDPQVQNLLNAAAASGRPPYHLLDAEAARKQFRDTRAPLLPPRPDVASVEDRHIPGPAGPTPVRFYRPHGSSPSEVLPALVYFHGGGWTIGDLDTHDVICRDLCNQARCALLSVDYRMGPEHKFPAAVEDSLAATCWLLDNAAHLCVDARRVAVGGDSAGGNLATVVALLLRDRGRADLCFQLLIYPVTDQIANTPSHSDFADGYMLTRESIRYFQSNYLRTPADHHDWRASPLLAKSVSRLPPALVITAGYDPLRDEGKAYADRLRDEGVAVTYQCYDGMIHGFFMMGGVLDDANRAVSQAAQALASALRNSAAGG